MPRPEAPIDSNTPANLRTFAEDLRKLRSEAGDLSYRKLAERAGYSAATLSQAASGRMFPTWAATRAFVLACGGDEDEWHRRWLGIADARKSPENRDAAPSSQMLRHGRHRKDDVEWFATELRLCLRVANRSLSFIAEKSGYARSTVHEALRGQKLPTWTVLGDLLGAAGVPEKDIDYWHQRWQKLNDCKNSPTVEEPPQEEPDLPATQVTETSSAKKPTLIVVVSLIAVMLSLLLLSSSGESTATNSVQPVLGVRDQATTWNVKVTGIWSERQNRFVGVFTYTSPFDPRVKGSAYGEGTSVAIVCQERHGQQVTDPKDGKSSRVWNKTTEGYWISDVYVNLSLSFGETMSLDIPSCTDRKSTTRTK